MVELELITNVGNIDPIQRQTENAVPVKEWNEYFSAPLGPKGKLAGIIARSFKPLDNSLIAKNIDRKYAEIAGFELLRKETLDPHSETVYDFFQYLLLHLEVTYHSAQMINRFAGGKRDRVGLLGVGQNHIEAEIINELVQPNEMFLADISRRGLSTLARRIPTTDHLGQKIKIKEMDLSGQWPEEFRELDMINLGTVLNWTTASEGQKIIRQTGENLVHGGLFISTVLTDQWTDKVVSDHVGSEMQRNPGRTIGAALTAKEWAANTYLSHDIHRPNLDNYVGQTLPSTGFKVIGIDTDIYWPLNGSPVAAIVAAERI